MSGDAQRSREARIGIEADFAVDADRAAIRRGGGKVVDADLVAVSGDASVEKVRTITVSDGTAKRDVTLYEISGLAYSPSPIWLDAG